MSEEKSKNPGAKNAAIKLAAVKALKEISNEGPWTLTQEILQEIMASFVVTSPDKMPPITELVQHLKKEIEVRYAGEPEVKKILLESVPAPASVRVWVKKDGWEEAVWETIRGEQLFSAVKRAEVIESLRKRATTKSDQAAKIWLTLSGDYSEKMEVNDKTLDTYREI